MERSAQFGEGSKDSLGVGMYSKGSRRLGVKKISRLECCSGSEANMADLCGGRVFVGIVGQKKFGRYRELLDAATIESGKLDLEISV